MACPEFDDLLREGAGGHAERCEECRALLDALARVEGIFDRAFTGIGAPPGMAAAVRARLMRECPVPRPSVIPEILDFIGWAAVLAVIAIVIPRFLPLISAMMAELG